MEVYFIALIQWRSQSYKSSCLLWKLFFNGCAGMVETGKDRGENNVSFPVQIYCTSCLPRWVGPGKNWRDWSREKEPKAILQSISFPGFSHMATDGLSLEDWSSESSCSRVLVLIAGVAGPLCTGWMPHINGFHCACMHELSCPGSCPMPAWNRGLGKITLHTYLHINGKIQSPILYKWPWLCEKLLRC